MLGVTVSLRPVDKLDRGRQQRTELFGPAERGVGVDHSRLERGELVAVETAQADGVRHGGAQALGHRQQDLVTHGVAERVVHQLEAVEVEEEQHHAPHGVGVALA